MDIKKASEQLNRAKTYKNGIKTPFFKELKRKLESEIELFSKMIILPGYETPEKELEAKITARAYKKLLMFIEDQAGSVERREKTLKEIA